jgi:fatty-acyl-CoA synthase
VEPALIFGLIREHRVTHFCGAPVVHNMLINAPDSLRAGIDHTVHGMLAGAAPPQAVIEGAERIGVNLTHVYGLTEVYGPASVCAKHPEWDQLPVEKRAELNGRQGVTYPRQEAIMVADPETLRPVPRDGQTMGEIFFRGNITMKGYLKNPKATEEAFAGGWYHTGDLAVIYPDGYVKIRDRSKDIIISGGENISTIEVEDVLYNHPAVFEAAVVARPDEKWGERLRLRNAQTGSRTGFGGGAHRVLPRAPGRLQGAEEVVFGPLPRRPPGRFRSLLRGSRQRRFSAGSEVNNEDATYAVLERHLKFDLDLRRSRPGSDRPTPAIHALKIHAGMSGLEAQQT